MITIISAIDYATDHRVRVSDEYRSKVSRTKAMSLADGFTHIEIRQLRDGSRSWLVEGSPEIMTRANAIITGVNKVIAMTKALDEVDE